MGCKSGRRRFLDCHCLPGQLLPMMMVRRQVADRWRRAAAGPPHVTLASFASAGTNTSPIGFSFFSNALFLENSGQRVKQCYKYDY
jgi:hypothetical protein